MSKRKKPAGRKTAPLDAEALTWPPFFERLGLRMDGSRPRPSVRDVERAFDFWRTLPDRMRRKGWPCGASAAERLNRLWSFHLAAEEILCVEAERLGLDSSSIWESGEACYNLLLRQPRFADRTTPPNRIAYWPHCLGRRRAGLSADEKQAVLAAERVLARLFKKLPAEAGQAVALAVEPSAGKPLSDERRTVLMKKAEAARILTGRQSARSREVKKALERYDWRDEGDRKGTLRLDKMDAETAARFRGQDKVSHREPLGGPRMDARPAKT